MATLLSETKELSQHRVEFYRRKKWLVVNFDNTTDAYQFWLYLKRGTFAKLYQNGKQTGEGA